MTPLQTLHLLEKAKEMAQRNGFTLEIDNKIDVIACKAPYAKSVRVATLDGFQEVVTYFSGYEQMRFETKELNRLDRSHK